METIGKRIANERKKLEITQNELAEKLMVSNKAVSKWESDMGNPGFEFLPQLAQLFGCSLDYLILGKKNDKLIGTLPFRIGVYPYNNVIVGDLANLIHLSIMGKDGSGKTTFLNNMILDLLDNVGPDNFKFVLIDNYRKEFEKYKKLKNLLYPVAESVEDAIQALKICDEIMAYRFDLFMETMSTSLDDYASKGYVDKYNNQKIVVIIDDVSCYQYEESFRDLVSEMIQLGRTVGIHVVTSLTDMGGKFDNMLTGPSLIAFKCDNRSVLNNFMGTTEAVDLSDRGELLYVPYGFSTIARLKGIYRSAEEIENELDISKYLQINKT